MNRSTLHSTLSSLFVLATPVSLACADAVLNNNGTYMTTTQLARTARQDALPLWWNRGTDLEGGIRFGGDVPASPGFNSGMGAATMGGIELASLGFALSEVDMALPTNGPAVVIGRSFNHRQGSDASVAASNGLQGYNWFQSAMPEIVVYSGGGANDDVVYLVYGANRFMEFHETSTTGKFKGMNGTTGIVEYVAGAGGTPYDTYTITDQNGWSWVFWGGNTASHKADWQLWKKSDPQGLTVYAGDKTSHSSAVSNGYATGGGISTLYQEFGDPSSPTERRYLFTYTTVSSVDRLTSVSAEIKASGSWGSPSGLTEIGRVEYAYYTTGTTHNVDSNDYFGLGGDLKSVTIRTPLTDSGTGSGAGVDLSSGIYDSRSKYYRYYGAAYNGSDNRRGHPHALKLVLGFEGARRYDWLDTTFNATYAGTGIATSALTEYSDAYYEYESSSSTQRLATAFFNGECGCGGGANGQYAFSYADSSSAATYRGGTTYDTGWASRTVITQPDSTYQVRYFDELGQPLSTVVTTSTGSGPYWATGIVRDSNGRVTEVHSPANTSYVYSTDAITYDGSVGLISTLTRYTSTDLTGLIKETAYQTGTGGGSVLLTHTDFSQQDFSVASKTLSKPYATVVKQYFDTGGGDHNDIAYAPVWWSNTSTSPLYVTLKSMTTTLPAVISAENGENTTHDMVAYLRKDGRTAFTVATDGVWTAMKYNTLGLPVRTIQDADPNISGDFDANYGPGDYSLSTSSNGGLAYPSAATYDSIGRVVTSIARPDGSNPVKRIAETYYSKLADGRLATIGFPRVVSTTYYGPASYSVTNHAGKSEFSCTLGFASTSSAKADWLDETYADPVFALENASANLGGTLRVNIFRIGTTIYNTPGSKVDESRSYTAFATTSTWTGSVVTNYDRTAYVYDNMGRTVSVKDATDTITRTVYDELGRVTARWVGLTDTHGWTATSGNGSSGGNDDLTQVETMVYDAAGVGNSLLTKRTAYISGHATTGVGSSTGKRETSYLYDVRGNLIVTVNPLAPHSVSKYDLRRRVTASALYNDVTGLSAATDPTTTATANTGATIRLALSETSYDARGQAWKGERFKVVQTDGTIPDSLESLTWRDAAGRVIKQGGTSNSKTAYDRLGRPIHQYTLARNNDTTYAHAVDVSGDIVLEQSDTIYDNADKTGLVVMTATIMRNYDDTSTTGALDTNSGDSSAYGYDLTGTTDNKGRIQITSYWYDELDRPTTTAVSGSNRQSGTDYDFSRRPSGTWLSEPNQGDTVQGTNPLVSKTIYHAAGVVAAVQAPKVDTNPIETDYLYDQALRKIAEIRNYKNGTPSGPTGADDVFTRYTYSAGRMATMWVDLDGDNAVDADDQVTTYVYGTTKNTTAGTSRIKSNQLLDHVLYPPQGIAMEVDADHTCTYAYNAQGQKTWQEDGNGTALQWTYDDAGRKTLEAAGRIPGGVDSAVQSIETAYDARGMVSTVTQYDDAAATGGHETDEVKYLYDDWGNLEYFKQNAGAKVTGSNDYVTQYTYSKVSTTSPTAGIRRSGIRRTAEGLLYNSTLKQEITYTYTNSDFGTTLYDDDIGRVTRQTRSYPTSAVLLSLFRYGGVGLAVSNYLVESGVSNAQAGAGTAGWNDGFDRFGRTIHSAWKNGGSGGTYYEAYPSYDDNSNITGVYQDWMKPWSALYDADNLNRVNRAKTGFLVTGAIADADTALDERWKVPGSTLWLDQTGNWTKFKAYRGDPSLTSPINDQAGPNVFNLQNQIDTVVDTADDEFDVVPTYDKAGNFMNEHRQKSMAVSYDFQYDAWNRLRFIRTVSNAGAVVEEFRYNGLGQRIGWHYDENASGTVNGSDAWFYLQYNERWQEVAMYKGSATSPLETYAYHKAGLDGFGGSSYIDDVCFRERDTDNDTVRDERLYYLQNWRHDVVAIMKAAGELIERVRYDAYGRPSSYSPLDNSGLSGGPNGLVAAGDLTNFTTVYNSGAGPVNWITDLGKSGGTNVPDGVIDNNDGAAATSYIFTGHNGGLGQLSDSRVNNRRGFAGYTFDTVLAGAGTSVFKPVYHVRHRVLAADTGKWLQKDPMGYVDGMDLYEYCQSSPIEHIDPDAFDAYKIGYDDPPLSRDAGSGTWNTTTPTVYDYATQALLYAGVEAFRTIGYGNAARHMEHYLGASGSDYIINFQNMIESSRSGKDTLYSELKAATAFAERLRDGGYPITSGSVTSGYITRSDSADWFFASGGYSVYGKAFVKKHGRHVIMVYDHYFFDRYNWDKGKSTTIAGITFSDAAIGSLHKCGLAKEFDMYGHVGSYWLEWDVGQSEPAILSVIRTHFDPSFDPATSTGAGRDGTRDRDRDRDRDRERPR